ncbi:MAG: autotransporter-associated beta strand repeat-containing protein [Opitutaceae bacterium]|jgi:fibronectin-binding autotransporter adhesin
MNTTVTPAFARLLSRGSLLVLTAASLAPFAAAQTTWDGGGADNTWATPGNWNNDTAPTSGGTTAVQLAGSVRTSIDVAAPFTLQALTVNAGAGAFTLSGSLLTLNGTSPDSGSTIRNSSSNLLTINNDLQLTAGSGIYANSGDITLKGNIDLNGQTIRLLAAGSTRAITFDGVISGTSTSFAYNGFSGSAGVFNVNAANTYTATTSIWHGTVIANNGGAFSTGGVSLGVGGSAGTYNASLLTGQAVTIANNIRLVTKTNTSGVNNQTIGSQHTTGTSVFSGTTTLGSDSAAGEDLTVTAAGASRVNFTGNLVRASGATGSTDTVTKTGTGIVALSGSANNYSGTTTVSAGTLLVNGTLDSAGAAVTANSGTTFGGNGTVNRAINILDGATLSAGDMNGAGVSQAGTFTAGNSLTFANTSILAFDLGTTSDTVTVTLSGGLTLDGTLNVTAGSGFGAGTYTLFSYAGSFLNNTLNIGSTPSDYSYALDFSSAGQVNLVVSAIPEPSTWAALVGTLALGATCIRRRRR